MEKRDLHLTTIGVMVQRDDTESVGTFDHVSCIVRSCTNMHMIILVPIQEINYEINGILFITYQLVLNWQQRDHQLRVAHPSPGL